MSFLVLLSEPALYFGSRQTRVYHYKLSSRPRGKIEVSLGR
jgi:hypothetical protein